jgi:glycopeptide antibiotics resistance protein
MVWHYLKETKWLVAPSASRFFITVPLAFSLFIQILTGFPRAETLRKISADELLIKFSEGLFNYPFWLQDLSHIPLFFTFTWLWAWYFRRKDTPPFGFYLTLTLCLTYAIFNELVQIYIPQRFPSIDDLINNLIGVSGAILVHTFAYNRILKKQKNMDSKRSSFTD